MHNMFTRCIAAVGIALSSASNGADFSFRPASPRGLSFPSVVMSGEIQRGDYERLQSFIRKDFDRFRSSVLVLTSPGGDLFEAIKIGNIVKASYSHVSVYESVGVCASACFLIYVASVSRGATLPSIGIHRPYFDPHYFSKLSIAQAEVRHKELTRKIREYLEEREVPQYLIEKMFSLSSDEVYWLTYDDLDRIGL